MSNKLKITKEIELRQGMKFTTGEDVYMLCKISSNLYALVCIDSLDTISMGNRYADYSNFNNTLLMIQNEINTGRLKLMSEEV